jgi:hypothetical protein
MPLLRMAILLAEVDLADVARGKYDFDVVGTPGSLPTSCERKARAARHCRLAHQYLSEVEFRKSSGSLFRRHR